MIKKIGRFFSEMIGSHIGSAFLTLVIMLLLSIFNLWNSTLPVTANVLMIPILLLAFALPILGFVALRGGKQYIKSFSLNLPSKSHVPTIIWATLLIFFGSTLLKLVFVDGKYIDFPLYSTFVAHRNGNFLIDLYLILAFCLIPPLLESFIFRGIALKDLEKRGRLTATICSSVLFALLGFDMLELLPRFFVGCVLCMVFYATDSIVLAATMHVAYNIFATFIEPTLVSVKNVSANFELFIFIVLIITLTCAFLLLSSLSSLYQKYAHEKFGINTTKSTSRKYTIRFIGEFLLSIPTILCFVVFVVMILINQ